MKVLGIISVNILEDDETPSKNASISGGTVRKELQSTSNNGMSLTASGTTPGNKELLIQSAVQNLNGNLKS